MDFCNYKCFKGGGDEFLKSKNDYGYFASESALSLTDKKLPSSWVGASVFTALNPMEF